MLFHLLLPLPSTVLIFLHAASLLSMLSNKGAPLIPSRRISSSSSSRHHVSAAQQQQQLQAQRAAAAASAAAAMKRLSGRDLEHLQQLHAFFSGLVDDMAAAVQRLALQGFHQWLVRQPGRDGGTFKVPPARVQLGCSKSSAACVCAKASKQASRQSQIDVSVCCLNSIASFMLVALPWIASPKQLQVRKHKVVYIHCERLLQSH